MSSPRPLALVTGASSGIGRVFAERLARRGHDLLLVARDAARLEAVAGELAAAHGIACEIFPADLSEPGDIARVAGRIATESRLAVLVNNAGFGTRGVIGRTDPEAQGRMLTLHVQAVHELTQAAIPGMRERRTGHIIVVASVASWVAAPGNVNYNATKAYQRMYCEALAMELAGSGVRIQALCPGFTYSEFHDRLGTGRRGLPEWSFLPAERVVDVSLAQAFGGGGVVCIPGFRWKAIVFLMKYAAPLLAPLRGRYRRD